MQKIIGEFKLSLYTKFGEFSDIRYSDCTRNKTLVIFWRIVYNKLDMLNWKCYKL